MRRRPACRGSARAGRRPSKKARAGRALCARAKKDAGQGDKAAGRRRALGERRENTPPSPLRKGAQCRPPSCPTRAFRAGLLAGLPPMPLAEWREGGGRRKRRRASPHPHPPPPPPPPRPPPRRAGAVLTTRPRRAVLHARAAHGSRRIAVHFGRIPARQESSARPNASMTRFAPAWCSRTSSKVTWTYRPCALLFLFSTMIL